MLSRRRLNFTLVVFVIVLASSSSWAQPNIQVGSATGAPGEMVNIPVTFANNGTVVGFQFDLTFGSTQFTIGTLTDGPALSPHLRHSSIPSAGTLRVVVRPEVSATLPKIDTGILLNIPITISATSAYGPHDLTLAGVVFSDSSANAVSAGTLTKGQITVGAPEISVSPSTLALEFGAVKVGTPSTAKPVAVSNVSSATANLVITNIEITGANAGEFSKDRTTCPPLAPGDPPCTINVTFTPASVSPPAKTATLKIESNDPDQGVVNVTLSGSGGVPQILARRMVFNEDFTFGIPADWTNVDAWSTGCGRLIGSPFVAPWAIVDPPCGTVTSELLYTPVLDASSCTKMALLFSSWFTHGTGTSGVVSVTDNYGKTWVEAEAITADEGPNWKEVGLDGLAGSEGAQIEFGYLTSGGVWAIDNVQVLCEPANLTFKSLKRPSSQVQTLVIANTGTADLNVTSLALSGDYASQFDVEAEDCTGKAVEPSGHCTVQVAFSPETKGVMDRTALSILSDAAPSPLSIPLVGKGVDLLVTQEEGTLGSQVKILGAAFGAKKGKVLIGGAALKVLGWGPEEITGLISKAGTTGPSDVEVQRKDPKGAGAIKESDAFSLEPPKIWRVVPDHGVVNTPVTITGKYFGAKKGKVTMGGKSCKVTGWAMDATTGASTVHFLVPKGLATATAYSLKVVNAVGEGSETFTAD